MCLGMGYNREGVSRCRPRRVHNLERKELSDAQHVVSSVTTARASTHLRLTHGYLGIRGSSGLSQTWPCPFSTAYLTSSLSPWYLEHVIPWRTHSALQTYINHLLRSHLLKLNSQSMPCGGGRAEIGRVGRGAQALGGHHGPCGKYPEGNRCGGEWGDCFT